VARPRRRAPPWPACHGGGWTRKGLDGKPEGGWIPQQAIDLPTSIEGYTLGSARANFLENDRGSITVGKYADLALLSENLFRIPAERIKDVCVALTLAGGRVVHSEWRGGSGAGPDHCE
jgi:predicted amidohydrolase YtcJ